MEALATGLAGVMLKDLSEEALLVAKKVKRETSVGSGSVSMASLAADELAAHLAAADNPTIALIGAGPMTVKIARYIADHNLGKMIFVNRTPEKVAALAEQFSGSAVSLSEFLSVPPRVDAIVSATAATEPVFQLEFLTRLPKSATLVLCIDLAIPRDFAISFNNDARVKVVDIPYLRSRCSTNLRQKFIETGKASEIVRQAVNEYLCDRIEGSLKPIFHDSFQESMNLARRALDDLFAKKVTSLTADEKDAIYRLVGKLIANSAFQPVKTLSDKLSRLGDDLNLSDLSHPKQAV
jgi:glutamyl-tRNA reductase